MRWGGRGPSEINVICYYYLLLLCYNFQGDDESGFEYYDSGDD